MYYRLSRVWSRRTPPVTPAEEAVAAQLRCDVETLATDIGPRHLFDYPKLVQTAEFLEATLSKAGHQSQRQTFTVLDKPVWNIEVTIPGSTLADEIMIVGAHYDTIPTSPGANDNGSGIATVLHLARSLASMKPQRTLRLVCFVNEESPWFGTEAMGALQYARRCRERSEKVRGMICLETLAYYSQAPGSQRYPVPLIAPKRGCFLAFVSDFSSARFLRRAHRAFMRSSELPSSGIALPKTLVTDISRSDHLPFWREGFPAIMLTDTANFRYRHYHTPEDIPANMSWDLFARAVLGIEGMVRELVGG